MSVRVANQAECEARLHSAGSRLVVLAFTAAWCDPCHRMTPHFEALAAAHPEVLFLSADAEECLTLAKQFGVRCVPTFVFVRAGKQIEIFSGANEAQLRDLVINLK